MPSLAERLLRPNVRGLTAYQSARSTAKGGDDLILLDAAENPYCPFTADDERPEFQTLNRYPEPQPSDVLDKLAQVYDTPPETILITRGSEEGIRLLLQTFCVPGTDRILLCPPTFALYPIEAKIHDTAMVTVPRRGELYDSLDHDSIIESVRKAGENPIKLIFLCNPGNPASTLIPFAEIDSLVTALADDCMVVVDEAYIDFADAPSFVTRIASHPNLIVLRTLSKGYGLAGLRSGAILANPETVGYIRRITSAYPVPRSTQLLTTEALREDRLDFVRRGQNLIKDERSRMIVALHDCHAVKRVFPSRANFLCVEVQDAAACVAHFAANGINIRNRSAAIPNCVNIAVGTPHENDEVLKVFGTL